MRQNQIRKIANALFAMGIGVMSASAFANRITTPTDAALRCANEPMPPEKCDSKRKKARDTGCITSEEFDSLVSFGSFATCDYDESPPQLNGWCACGCFDQSVRILGAKQAEALAWHQAGEVTVHPEQYKIATLSAESSLQNLSYELNPLRISTKGPEGEPLFVITTEFGSALKLTANHAVLLATGKMVTARDLKVHDYLVSTSGNPVLIRGITRATPASDVVNFATESNDKLQHVIAAEGVLVGDLLWQASFVDDLNAVIIRQ